MLNHKAFFYFMDISFKSIAFQLKYNSEQIDSVYRALLLEDKGDYKIPAFVIACMNIDLPSDFKKYVESSEKDVNILFEQRIIDTDKSNDWDLFEI
jgi:hypothetical protein